MKPRRTRPIFGCVFKIGEPGIEDLEDLVYVKERKNEINSIYVNINKCINFE